MKNGNSVLCVDLDGTLVKTDLLHENIFLIIKSNPLMILPMLGWLLKGKTYFKSQINQRSQIHFESLPLNKEVLEFVRHEKESGRKVYLVSANTLHNVEGVAKVINLFDGVYCTDDSQNLKGASKAKFLTDKFGEKGFDYIGDHRCDAPVFQAANKSLLVSKRDGYDVYFRKKGISFEKIFQRNESTFKNFFKTIRIHQWTKNSLIFLPLILAHRVMETDLLLKAVYCFFSFSFVASATYIINDLFDLPSDRVHRTKKNRPIPRGSVSIATAMGWMMALLILAGFTSTAVSMKLVKFLLIYIVVTLSYSIRLKRIVMMDVLVLAFLYTLRILIGSWVVGVPLSQWLFSFSIFLFCSLGFLKRNNELVAKSSAKETTNIPGRGYLINDLSIIQLFGISTGVASVLIFVLYINSDQVRLLYRINYWLWMIAPLFLYWMGRMWLIASRGHMHEDPVVFAIKDRGGYAIIFLIAMCMLFAKLGFIPL